MTTEQKKFDITFNHDSETFSGAIGVSDERLTEITQEFKDRFIQNRFQRLSQLLEISCDIAQTPAELLVVYSLAHSSFTMLNEAIDAIREKN